MAEGSFFEETYAWFNQEPEPVETVSIRRALAWFETPNAYVKAEVIGYGRVSAKALLRSAAAAAKQRSLPDWRSVDEATHYLEKMLTEVKNGLNGIGEDEE